MKRETWFRSALLLTASAFVAPPMTAGVAEGDTPEPATIVRSMANPDDTAARSQVRVTSSTNDWGEDWSSRQFLLASNGTHADGSGAGACRAPVHSGTANVTSASSAEDCSIPYPLCTGPPYYGNTCCVVIPTGTIFGTIWFCLRKVCGPESEILGSCLQFETVASGRCD